MVLTMLPTAVLADEPDETDGPQVEEPGGGQAGEEGGETPAEPERTGWASEADTSWYTDDNSEFTIDTAAKLAGLAQLVNEGNDFQGKKITLTAAVDLSGKAWTPIGTKTAPFKGTFDGGNKVISNLKVDMPSDRYAGLFGFLEKPGTLENVVIGGADVTGLASVGVLAGAAHTGTVSGCKVQGTIAVQGNYKVGGLAGEGYAAIENCTVACTGDSTVTGIWTDGNNLEGDNVGGLVGYRGEGPNITTKNCSVSGVAVTGTRKVGGLIGSAFTNNQIEECSVSSVNVTSNATAQYAEDNAKTMGVGGLLGFYTVDENGVGTLSECAVENVALDCEEEAVKDIAKMGLVSGGVRTDDGAFVAPTPEQVTVSGITVTGDNASTGTRQPVAQDVAIGGVMPVEVTIGGTTAEYPNLAAAVAAANEASGSDGVVITIKQSGNYAPFTISRGNVTVQAAEGIEAVVNTAANDTIHVAKEQVTLKGLRFTADWDGPILRSTTSENCDSLVLDGCTFTKTGEAGGSIALYIHRPNITIQNCTFENWERGYYTCGDNHAAGAMTFTGNTFTNVRIPLDGYWGEPATEGTNIQITGNTFTAGTWGTAYIQLWDYAQYQYWLKGEQSTLNPEGKSALVATISGNTYTGDVVIYKTHCDWYDKSEVTIEESAKVVNRHLVELEGVESATVVNKDGSAITAFNESTASQNRGGKLVIYSISEGEYIFKVKPETENDSDVVLSEEVTVKAPEIGKPDSINKVIISSDVNINVAKVGDEEYASLAEAIEAAKDGGTVELLNDVEIDTWNQVWDANGLTIKGNGHTVTIDKVESNGNGNYLFFGAENLKVEDLTVHFRTSGNGFDMKSGILTNVTMNGAEASRYAVFAGTGDSVKVNGCEFNNFNIAIYSQPANGGTADIEVSDSAFTDCGIVMTSYAANTTFTGNTVTGSSEISFAAAADGGNADSEKTYTVTGNKFENAGKIWFYGADLNDVAFTKNQVLGETTVSTEDAEDGTTLTVTGNYWGGGEPGGKLSGSNTAYDNYYTAPTMRDEDLNKYTVTFVANGGSAVSPQEVTHGQTAAAPSPTREHYELQGWFTDEALTDPYDFNTPVTGAITLFAKWEQVSTDPGVVVPGNAAYKVEHYKEELDGGYTLADVDFPLYYELGAVVNAEAKIYVGYTLDEENENAVPSGTVALPAAGEDGQPVILTLKLYYKLNEYTVSFNSDGGSAVGSQTVKYGGGAVRPENPTKLGYTFTGWELDGTAFDFGTAITDDITLTAQWSRKSSGGSSGGSASSGYAVSVGSMKNGAVSISPKNAKKDDTVTITVIPDKGYKVDAVTVTDKDGKTIKVTAGKNGKYTFTMPASKVKVAATFTKIEETPAHTFTDVPDGHWAGDEIAWAYEQGYMNGNTAVTFNPGGTVTRQQLWMILARLSGQRPAGFAEAKAWAVQNGVSDGTAPGKAVSRQQLVTILYRCAQLCGYDVSGAADLTAFPDHASVAAYAADAMSWSVANGIVGGTAQGTLNPNGTATRAQFAAILYRFCEKTVK